MRFTHTHTHTLSRGTVPLRGTLYLDIFPQPSPSFPLFLFLSPVLPVFLSFWCSSRLLCPSLTCSSKSFPSGPEFLIAHGPERTKRENEKTKIEINSGPWRAEALRPFLPKIEKDKKKLLHLLCFYRISDRKFLQYECWEVSATCLKSPDSLHKRYRKYIFRVSH